jgi:hypothetical protein
MAFYTDRAVNKTGELNSAFILLMVVGLLGFALVATVFG